MRLSTPGPGVLLPRRPYKLLAFGGSAGAIVSVTEVLAELSPLLPFPIAVVQHVAAGFDSQLPAVIGWKVPFPCQWMEEGALPRAGVVHVARGGRNWTLDDDGCFRSVACAKPPMGWPSVDVFLTGLARVHREAGIAVVLSGMMSDGAEGIAAVRRGGGATMVQRPAAFSDMPVAAVDLGRADLALSTWEIARAITVLAERGIE